MSRLSIPERLDLYLEPTLNFVRKRLRICLVLGVAFFVGFACTDDSVSPRLTVPTKPALVWDPDEAVLATTEFDPSGSHPMRTYSDSIVVALEIHRTIRIDSDPNGDVFGEPTKYSGQLDGSGLFVSSTNQCYANVSFVWTDAAHNVYKSGPTPCRSTPITDSVWRDTLLVRGTGTSRCRA